MGTKGTLVLVRELYTLSGGSFTSGCKAGCCHAGCWRAVAIFRENESARTRDEGGRGLRWWCKLQKSRFIKDGGDEREEKRGESQRRNNGGAVVSHDEVVGLHGKTNSACPALSPPNTGLTRLGELRQRKNIDFTITLHPPLNVTP